MTDTDAHTVEAALLDAGFLPGGAIMVALARLVGETAAREKERDQAVSRAEQMGAGWAQHNKQVIEATLERDVLVAEREVAGQQWAEFARQEELHRHAAEAALGEARAEVDRLVAHTATLEADHARLLQMLGSDAANTRRKQFVAIRELDGRIARARAALAGVGGEQAGPTETT